MKAIVVGAGILGYQVAKRLSEEDHDVVVVDAREAQLRRVEEFLDVGAVLGQGSSPAVLADAGLDGADMIVAVTGSDETNIVACLIAETLSPRTTRLARLRDPAYRGTGGLIDKSSLHIDMMISPEEEVAKSVGLLADIPGSSDVLEFAGGRVKVVGVRIGPECPLLGKELRELRALQDERIARFLVAGVYRREMVNVPSMDMPILEGDTLFLVATAESVRPVVTRLGKNWVRTRHVMIAGGGRTGALIAARLAARGIHVKLIEEDPGVCEALAKELDDVVVLNGEGIDQSLLVEEGIQRVDLFVSAVEDDEDNVFTALVAKRLGAGRVVCLVDTPAYMPFASTSGIDVVLSPMLTALGPILQFIRQGRVLSVGTLREELVEGIEFVAVEGSDIVELPLEAVHMPKGSLVGAIVRGEEIVIPDASSVIEPGDRVILFSRPQLLPRLQRLIAAGQPEAASD